MKQSTVTVRKGAKWASLCLSLGAELDAGKCAFIAGSFIVDVKSRSSACETHESKTWEIAILSGAPFAFRLMNKPHAELVVHYLKGCLDDEDIQGVSIASSIAIVDLVGGDVRRVPTGEWQKVLP